MWISDCRARCTPVVNWVMLSWAGASCTAATCWLKWADITCSHRITTVLELLAASRFRLEPHWKWKVWVNFQIHKNTAYCCNVYIKGFHMTNFHVLILFYTHAAGDSTWSWVTFPSTSVGVCSFHWALVSVLLPPGWTTILHIAMRPWLVPAAKISGKAAALYKSSRLEVKKKKKKKSTLWCSQNGRDILQLPFPAQYETQLITSPLSNPRVSSSGKT